MKLVARETETDALLEWLRVRPIRLTSVLSKVEVGRAAGRVAEVTRDNGLIARASAVLATLAVVGISDAIAERAALLRPSTLRSLDAVHLATALLAGPLEAFVAYDDRLLQAARDAGLSVARP